MLPKFDNYCGGKHRDWIEVLLNTDCNGTCAWCIEKDGWHPSNHATADRLVDIICESDKKNVMLLGGEPTLYKKLPYIIQRLKENALNVYMTTNGSMINPAFILLNNLNMLTGINISIHHYNMSENKKITGIFIDEEELEESVIEFRNSCTDVRLNCNVFNGGISSRIQIDEYIEWAKRRGIENIRFNEMKGDKRLHVAMEDLFPELGMSNQPFINGCLHSIKYNGCNLSLRQMCGIETKAREKPVNPKTISHMKVLYYSGDLFDGWVRNRFEDCNKSVQKQLLSKFVKEVLDNG